MPAVVAKAYILDEIRRTARENEGKPLGSAKFRTETAIRPYDWRGVYWARWSDALAEAGFAPNEFQAPIERDELTRRYADLAKQLGHLPSDAELQLRRRRDPDLPTTKTYRRLGNKRELIAAVVEYCESTAGYEQVTDWCKQYLALREDSIDAAFAKNPREDTPLGCIYLAKSGRYYKIGKSNAAGRREYEIGLQLPEKLKMLHVITTDDPTGIEAYWHKRFEAKRKNGEWFDLEPMDVAAFKRRRKFM